MRIAVAHQRRTALVEDAETADQALEAEPIARGRDHDLGAQAAGIGEHHVGTVEAGEGGFLDAVEDLRFEDGKVTRR